MLMMGAGLLATVALAFFAFAGPSASKAQNRRLEVVRERHSKSHEVAAEAQLKRILQSRTDTRMEGFAQRFIPNPGLLRTRLQQTGKNWTLPQYVLASLGLVVVLTVLLALKGFPFLLALFVGLFLGIGLPHFIVGKMIKRRINKFTTKFPDALDLMVRGLRSGLPISETIGVVADEVPGPIQDEF